VVIKELSMKILIRLLVVAALIAGVVLFWMNLDALGVERSFRFYVVAGGVSVLMLGILYKFLGSWDLIPDWVPLIGKLDDWLAWLVMAVGLAAAAGGYYFLY